MEAMLKIVEGYKNKSEDIENSLEELIMEKLFDELPESKELGKRVRVAIRDVGIVDALGPPHTVTFGGIGDVVSSFTKEVSINLNITFVYHAEKNRI